MITPEHRKIGTIARELRIHPDAVRNAIESERFRNSPPVRASLAAKHKKQQ